jgi:hypothetical protein
VEERRRLTPDEHRRWWKEAGELELLELLYWWRASDRSGYPTPSGR